MTKNNEKYTELVKYEIHDEIFMISAKNNYCHFKNDVELADFLKQIHLEINSTVAFVIASLCSAPKCIGYRDFIHFIFI